MNEDKFFEAAQGVAQSISQWDLLILAGSIVIILSTAYYRPRSRRMRWCYFLFLPTWSLLAMSIFKGTDVQESYVAYLIAQRRKNANLIEGIAGTTSKDTLSEILYLKLALACLAIWLLFYIIWWVTEERVQDDGDTK